MFDMFDMFVSMYSQFQSSYSIKLCVCLFTCSIMELSGTFLGLFWLWYDGHIRTIKIHTCHSPQGSCFGLGITLDVFGTFWSISEYVPQLSIFSYEFLFLSGWNM